jgi:hypothetical protein
VPDFVMVACCTLLACSLLASCLLLAWPLRSEFPPFWINNI